MMLDDTFFLKPGGIFVSRDSTYIHTVLGSCISVCLFDSKNGVGGMNHFIYHHATSNARNCRYGDVAVPHLIKLLIETGGSRENLVAHIIGGSQSLLPQSDIGNENFKIAKDILKRYDIPLQVVDVGGYSFRKLIFHNTSGEVKIKKGEL